MPSPNSRRRREVYDIVGTGRRAPSLHIDEFRLKLDQLRVVTSLENRPS